MNYVRIVAFVASLLMFRAAFPTAALAQESQSAYPKAEIFAGYQYTRLGGSGGINANGFNTAATTNFSRWFGVTADLSGAYKSVSGVSARTYMYTFGPTFSARRDRLTPFVHFLAGGFHASASVPGFSTSTNGFAMMLGGGLDFKVSDHFAVRAIQPDWILWRSHGMTDKSIGRVSTGIIIRF